MHWLKRRQRGNIPGRGGSGRGRASHVGQRNSLRTNRVASRLAPACRNARASSVCCGCPRYDVVGRAPAFPVLTKVVLSRFRRPRLPLEPDVSVRKFLPDQEEVTSGSLRKMLSQHLILVTRQVNCSFGLECLAQTLL